MAWRLVDEGWPGTIFSSSYILGASGVISFRKRMTGPGEIIQVCLREDECAPALVETRPSGWTKGSPRAVLAGSSNRRLPSSSPPVALRLVITCETPQVMCTIQGPFQALMDVNEASGQGSGIGFKA